MTEKEKISAIGIDHRNTPISLREQLTVPEEEQGMEMARLAGDFPNLQESVLVSTCNRVELYMVPADNNFRPEKVFKKLAEDQAISWSRLKHRIYKRTGRAGIQHLFRVTSGLESMILGETQIIHQVKNAYEQAHEEDLTGKRLNILFQEALSTAKAIHEQTAVGEKKVSVGSIAVDFADRIYEDMGTKTALQIGAGKVARLCVKHLKKRGIKKLFISNRSREKAASIAEYHDAEQLPYQNVTSNLGQADILLVATGSRTPIINGNDLKKALRERQNEPLFVLDLAVPRNVSPSCENLDRVYLYNLDDLENIAKDNQNYRQEELANCEKLLEEHVDQYIKRLERMELDPFIKNLQAHFRDVGQKELSRSLKRLDVVEEQQREEMELMVDRILNKLLHDPIVKMKEEYEKGNGLEVMRTVRELFQMEDQQETENSPKNQNS